MSSYSDAMKNSLNGSEDDRQFEIMFSDLTEEAQKRYLEFQKVESSIDLNCDISPLAIIEKSEADEG